MATNFVITAVSAFKRIYPHVDQIKEFPTQQTIRLLWDRIHDLEERLQAAETNIRNLGGTVNEVNADAAAASQQAKSAFAIALDPGDEVVNPDPELPGGGDGGQGDAGCAAAPGTGHPAGVVPLSAFEAGKIVCGTGNEFPLLKAPTADLATREAMAEELLLRMIWHLQLAGFVSGRQRNPSSAISKDKLTVEVDGVLRAYDVFIGLSEFTVAMGTHMGEVAPPDYVEDPGIPD